MSIFDFFYNLKTSLLGAMSTSGMFNRLRAKLSSQQIPTKDIASLAEREDESNQKVLKKNISEAVSEALRNDEFMKAVAVHLASELQPSFKSLDPSVGADKLSAHTETLTKRLDAQDTKLTHLSTILDSNNSSSAEKICNIESVVNKISKSHAEFVENVQAAEKQHDVLLTSIGTEIALVRENIFASLEKLADLSESSRSKIVAEATAPFAELNTQLNTVLKTLEQYSTVLGEIKDATFSSKIHDHIEASNELHSMNFKAFSEMKEASEASMNEFGKVLSSSTAMSSALVANSTQIDEIKSLVTEIKNSEISSEILAETKASNVSHSKLTSTLDEIKSIQSEILPAISASTTKQEIHAKALEDLVQTESSVLDIVKSASLSATAQFQAVEEVKTLLTNDMATTSGLTNLESSVEKLNSTTETMSASLDEIKSAIARPQPVAEKVDLSNLESLTETISASINQIKSANESLLGKTHLAPLISTLDAHSAQLTDIKSTVLASAPPKEKIDMSSLESSVKNLSSMLESQITSLGDLKTAVAALENPQKIDISGLESSIQKITLSLESQKDILANCCAPAAQKNDDTN